MSKTYRSVMPQPADESAAWDAMGLSEALDECQDGESVRNEWPSEHGDSSGEIFSTLEDYHAPDGKTYHILFTTDWSNYHAPWTDTHATLYDVGDPDDVAEFKADVAEWEAKPETDPDYPDDDSEDDAATEGWDAIDTGTEDDHDAVCRLSAPDRERFNLTIVDGNEEGLAFLGTRDAVWAFAASLGADILPRVDGGWLPVAGKTDGVNLGQIDPAPSGEGWIFSGLNAPMRRVYESRS